MLPDAFFAPSAPIAPPKAPAQSSDSSASSEGEENFEGVFDNERNASTDTKSAKAANDVTSDPETDEEKPAELPQTKAIEGPTSQLDGPELMASPEMPKDEAILSETVAPIVTQPQSAPELTETQPIPGTQGAVIDTQFVSRAVIAEAGTITSTQATNEPNVALPLRSAIVLSDDLAQAATTVKTSLQTTAQTMSPTPEVAASLSKATQQGKPVETNLDVQSADGQSEGQEIAETVVDADQSLEAAPKEQPAGRANETNSPRSPNTISAPTQTVQTTSLTQVAAQEAIQTQAVEVATDLQGAQFDILRSEVQHASQIRISQSGALEPLVARGVDIARNASTQMVAQLKTDLSGAFEIRLDPPELGRVAVRVYAGEAGMIAQVSAERQDVLDLLRRNEAQMAREFAEAGYDNLSFDFSGSDQSDEWSDEGGTEFGGDTSQNPEQVPSTQTSLDARNLPSGRLDIRL